MSEITIFSKRKTSKEGKQYYIYTARIPKKDGSQVSTRVKFREECGHPDPEKCPVNIEFEKVNANMVVESYDTDDGETKVAHTLWISAWKSGSEYVDTSLDDFDI